MRRDVLAASVAAVLALMCVLVAHRPDAPRPVPSEPVTGCVSCHASDHPPDPVHTDIACQACHLGDPSASVVPLAHDGLEREPGALDTAGATCGACHPTHLARVQTSLMTTAAGLVSVDRWAFGELDVPHGHVPITQLLADPEPSQADDHIRRLCAGCHLGTRKDNRDDAIHGTGSGCGACHVDTRGDGHPAIEPLPSDHQCEGCHSRSGRISLSYQGLYEASPDVVETCGDTETLVDGRTVCRQEPDLHHTAGLSCIDCHLHTDLMGDGHTHAHKEEQVEVTCEACHGPVEDTRWDAISDDPTHRILRLRGETRAPDEAVRTGKRGTPIWNLRPTTTGTWTLFPKRGGEPVAVPQLDADHVDAAHARLTCDACHAPTVPTCVNCHTDYDPSGAQWDFGSGAVAAGQWRETPTQMSMAAPELGWTADHRVVAAVTGMDFTLHLPDGTTRTLDALAPASPHTTSRFSRTCVSCHTPDAQSPRTHPRVGTRPDFGPLPEDVVIRMARAARCLVCHDEDSPVYDNFDEAYKVALSTAHPVPLSSEEAP